MMRVIALTLIAGLALASETQAEGWGTIKGQVVFGGANPPTPVKIDVDKDKAACLKNGPLFTDDLVVNKNTNGVRYAFVWLAPVNGGTLPIHPALKTPAPKNVEIDQPCCQFVPHVIAMREGDTLIAKNSAAIPHNVHWIGGAKNPGNNVILPAGGKQLIKDLAAERMPVTVKCDIHGWMKAYVRIFDHPYFAITDENGNFEIKNAPAGSYQLIGWQERQGWVADGDTAPSKNGIPITIKADGVVQVKLVIDPARIGK
jgi:hypothetical protein